MFGPRLLRCSFCGRDETQVSKLVAGPRAYICDACVATARRLMENSKGDDSPGPKAPSAPWHRRLGRFLRLIPGGDLQRRVEVAAR
jgi:ATP-dependent Clp protease ATP-binding subunit ClpX